MTSYRMNTVLIFVVLYIISSLAVEGAMPNPSENFSAEIYLQGLNSTTNPGVAYSTGGSLYINFSEMERRLDYFSDYGTIYTEIDRCDLSPMEKYIIENDTCQVTQIQSEFVSMFSWLDDSIEGSSCFGSGRLFSAGYSWGSVTGCFEDDTPIFQAILWGDSESSAIQYIKFLTFSPFSPPSSVFKPPKHCNDIYNNTFSNNNNNNNNNEDDNNNYYSQDKYYLKPFYIPESIWQDQ